MLGCFVLMSCGYVHVHGDVMQLRICTRGCHVATYMYIHVHGDVMQLHVVHTCTWGCHAATYTGKVSN